MENNSMSFTEKQLQEIGSYIKNQIPEWIAQNKNALYAPIFEMELRERTVRVEEELKNQRDLMKQGFELMEKRFEQVDRRFLEIREDINNRFMKVENRIEDLSRRMFQFMIWSFGFTATATGIVIAVLK